jgi:RNA recognition motif-containing protein
MSAKLFVGNLSSNTSSDELSTLFSEVGLVESCQLITDRDSGRSKGFGFIEMDSKETAEAAKVKFNGQDLHGRALKVNDAKPKNDYQNSARNNGSR